MTSNSAPSALASSRANPMNFRPKTWEMFGKYLGDENRNLNIGCGKSPEPGFQNLDRIWSKGVDLVVDLEDPQQLHDVTSRGWYDCILASHVLEHVTNLIPLLRELHRALKVGGHLIAIVPHASSDAAWEDPTHVRAFTETSFYYWNKDLYDKPDHAGYYSSPVDFRFEVVETRLVPFEDVEQMLRTLTGGDSATAMEFGRRFLRNAIREVQAVLRKVE